MGSMLKKVLVGSLVVACHCFGADGTSISLNPILNYQLPTTSKIECQKPNSLDTLYSFVGQSYENWKNLSIEREDAEEVYLGYLRLVNDPAYLDEIEQAYQNYIAADRAYQAADATFQASRNSVIANLGLASDGRIGTSYRATFQADLCLFNPDYGIAPNNIFPSQYHHLNFSVNRDRLGQLPSGRFKLVLRMTVPKAFKNSGGAFSVNMSTTSIVSNVLIKDQSLPRGGRGRQVARTIEFNAVELKSISLILLAQINPEQIANPSALGSSWGVDIQEMKLIQIAD